MLLPVWLLLVFFCPKVFNDNFEEENYGVKYASDCEVCRVFAVEFLSKLSESGRKHEVIETGYSHTKEKKKTKYVVSELRLIETLDGICDRILEYNIHKERKDATRFAKGQSETFRTLEGLVAKGVKVDIGIPHQLWDKPSAEVTHLKTQCEHLLENYEEDIEEWYFHLQDKEDFQDYLCSRRALTHSDKSCLQEEPGQTKQLKGDVGEKTEL